MNKFKNIWFGFLLTVLISCGMPLGKMRTIPDQVNIPVKPIFKSDANELIYDMNLRFMKNYNSGILAIVRDSIIHENYRAVFLAKAGLKLFDFSFSPSSLKINYIIPQLDKKLIKDILEKDLRMLIDPLENQHIGFYQSTKSGALIWKSKTKTDFYHAFLSKEGVIYRLDKGTDRRSHVHMELEYDLEGFPVEVLIQHKKIPFIIRLTKLASVN